MAREITPVNVVRNPVVRAGLAHIVGTGRVIGGDARDPSVASSCAKYANVRYVREAETRVVSSRKHPRDSLPLGFAN